MDFLIAFLAAGLSFALLDFIWLSFAGPRLYRPRIGELLGQGLRWPPTIAFYLIYALGMTLLIVAPALRAGLPLQALIGGAILGLTAYATYDLTNWAAMKTWSALVAYLDMAWGAIATAGACWIGVTLTQMLAG